MLRRGDGVKILVMFKMMFISWKSVFIVDISITVKCNSSYIFNNGWKKENVKKILKKNKKILN